MSHHDENRGLCFKNHKIDLTKIEWAMNKQDVSRALGYKSYRENKNVTGYTVRDGLEFDGNQYDVVLLFTFVNNELHKTSITLRKELSIFGVKRRLSADFYDSPPDKLIRIVLEKNLRDRVSEEGACTH